MNLFRSTVSAFRTTPGTFSNGYYTPGPETTFPFRASVQPKMPDTQIIQPEGERQKQAYILYTFTRLYTVQESTGNSADQVEIDEVRYEVKDVKVWRDIIPHYEITVERIDNEGENT
jgi:hypothetical protein